VNAEMKVEEAGGELSSVQTLRLLADLIDQSAGVVSVTIEASFLRNVAAELEDALCNDINIMSSDGSEVIATISEPLSSYVIEAAVRSFITEAIRSSAERKLDESVDNPK
jgi:adhesin HecA-like repeat protein